MKKCPFCAEQIQDDAVKCRFCGEFLNKGYTVKTKWYHSTSAIVVGLIVLGPFALPLVWLHPRYKPITKVVVTIVVIAVTILLIYATMMVYVRLINQISKLGVG
jgi:uncharacterized membrane protein YvbJ